MAPHSKRLWSKHFSPMRTSLKLSSWHCNSIIKVQDNTWTHVETYCITLSSYILWKLKALFDFCSRFVWNKYNVASASVCARTHTQLQDCACGVGALCHETNPRISAWSSKSTYVWFRSIPSASSRIDSRLIPRLKELLCLLRWMSNVPSSNGIIIICSGGILPFYTIMSFPLIFAYIYFRLKGNLLSSHPSSSLHVLIVYDHHHMWTWYFLIQIN
jgi:hypothetical protein